MAIEEADYDLTNQALSNARGPLGVRVTFLTVPCKNAKLSAEAGRPIFEDVEFVTYHALGDRSNVIHRPVRPSDKVQFAADYARFRAGMAAAKTGTPLSEWPALSRSQVEELKFFGISTLEELAEVNDVNAHKFTGMATLRSKAKAYIDAASGNAPLEKLQDSLEQKDKQIEALQAQMATVLEKLAEKEEE